MSDEKKVEEKEEAPKSQAQTDYEQGKELL
jgi:hypothetical protein